MADDTGAAITKGKRKRLIIIGLGGVIVAACLGFAAKVLLEEDAKPAAKPVAQAPKPAAEAPKPGAEAPKPGAEAPKPAAEAPKPAAEAPKPAAAAPAKPGVAKPGAGPEPVARGSVVIPGNYAWDARTNSVGTGGDLLWQQKSEKERSLNPQGRAVLAVTDQGLAYDAMGAAEVIKFPFSSTPIPGSDGMTALDPGAVLGLRTQDGDYLKLRIVRYYDSHDFSFKSADALPAKWKDLQKGRPKVIRFSIELEWVAYPGPAIAAAKAAEARLAAAIPPPAPPAAPAKVAAKEPAPVPARAAETPEQKPMSTQEEKQEQPKPVAVARPPRPEPPSMPGPRYADVMTAVLYKDSEGVAELLALGKWVDRPDSRGKTPLMIAVANDDAALAEQLLKGGADASRGMSVAREFRNQPMQALMLRYGAR